MIGLDLQLRPVGPDDGPRLRRMFERLSPETVHRRFFTLLPSLDDRMLHALVAVDHEQSEAVVAAVGDEVIGLASYHRSRHDPAVAEVAIVVEDAWQHHGVGRRMTRLLAGMAAARGITRFRADVLPGNRPATGLIRRMSAGSRGTLRDGTLSYDMALQQAS